MKTDVPAQHCQGGWGTTRKDPFCNDSVLDLYQIVLEPYQLRPATEQAKLGTQDSIKHATIAITMA